MGSADRLTPEEGARITEIQDSLIELYVEQKEALGNGERARRPIGYPATRLRIGRNPVCVWLRCIASRG